MTDFTWNKLADWYLEVAKIEKGKEDILAYILKTILKLWHPFTPFVSESIWENFNDSLLMVTAWPKFKPDDGINLNNEFSLIQSIVSSVRNARSENRIEPARKIEAEVFTLQKEELLRKNEELIKGLKTNLKSLSFINSSLKKDNSVLVIVDDVEISLLNALESEAEKKRLEKEQANLTKLVNIQENKLANKDFCNNAPENIVKGEEIKLNKYKQDLEKINNLLENL